MISVAAKVCKISVTDSESQDNCRAIRSKTKPRVHENEKGGLAEIECNINGKERKSMKMALRDDRDRRVS